METISSEDRSEICRLLRSSVGGRSHYPDRGGWRARGSKSPAFVYKMPQGIDQEIDGEIGAKKEGKANLGTICMETLIVTLTVTVNRPLT